MRTFEDETIRNQLYEDFVSQVDSTRADLEELIIAHLLESVDMLDLVDYRLAQIIQKSVDRTLDQLIDEISGEYLDARLSS